MKLKKKRDWVIKSGIFKKYIYLIKKNLKNKQVNLNQLANPQLGSWDRDSPIKSKLKKITNLIKKRIKTNRINLS
jgi:hypothetical protein